MAEPKTFKITIDSILGGLSEYENYAAADQYSYAMGIDPDFPNLNDNTGILAVNSKWGTSKTGGYITPVSTGSLYSQTESVMFSWIVSNPRNTTTTTNYAYVYGNGGSVYSIDSIGTVTGLSDGGSMSGAGGNGAEYYDNYIYFAKNTTVARYGPLSGTPAFDGDYWGTTLGKTALVNTVYPAVVEAGYGVVPNHVMHTHNDGRLYFADVVGNQGYLHYIQTTKTSVEGDTDNGSTYQKIFFPPNHWPIAIESYGSDLAIALFEGVPFSNASSSSVGYKRAKIAFWDTLSQNFYKIVEFSDPLISALKFDPVSGTLYVFSGQEANTGTRVSAFIGGYSFQQVALIPDSIPPLQGAVDVGLNKVYFGGLRQFFDNTLATYFRYPCVWALGSNASNTGKVLTNILASKSTGSLLSALKLVSRTSAVALAPYFASYTGTTSNLEAASKGGTYLSFWKSQNYRMTSSFKITSVRIPIDRRGAAIGDNLCELTPVVVIDGGSIINTLTTISYPDGGTYKKFKKYRPTGLTGQNDFSIGLSFEGTSNSTTLFSVGLPIVIEGELIDD